MLRSFIFLANRGGIPRIQSRDITVTATNVAYNFDADVAFSANFSGLVLVRLSQAIPTGTTTTLPIVFSSNAGTQALTTYDGEAVTVADVAGTGVFLCFYDRATNTLQALTGVTI